MGLRHTIMAAVATAAAVACSADRITTPVTPVPPAPPVLLRDVVLSNLPSPYYHFEYDNAGRVRAASLASGLRMYDVTFDDRGIKEMQNTVIVNHDRLDYLYDDAGRVGAIKYVDSTGVVYTVLFFRYDGQKLIGIERDRRVSAGFIIDKQTALFYDADGNLSDLMEHRPAIDGQQPETTTFDHFEDFDGGINVDAFSVLHTEFFDHLFLLPAVRLQSGNPRHVTHTGDGTNFDVRYSYVYDDRNRPVTKSGDVTLLNGTGAGTHVQISSLFSYY
jgi:hypothetical protein